MASITNDDDTIDSRDVITRLEELEGEIEAEESLLDEIKAERKALQDRLSKVEDTDHQALADLQEEVGALNEDVERHTTALEELHDENNALVDFANEGEKYAGDWLHGVQLIRESYFEQHIKELVTDCWPDLDDILESSDWPNRHLKMDWESAADEAKVDYNQIDFDGVTYYVR